MMLDWNAYSLQYTQLTTCPTTSMYELTYCNHHQQLRGNTINQSINQPGMSTMQIAAEFSCFLQAGLDIAPPILSRNLDIG